jgi:hypothetical protein
MGYCVGSKSTKIYKIPKLVHFRSTLILNETKHIEENQHLDSGTQIPCRRTDCMTMGKTTTKNIIGRKFNLKNFLWVQKEVDYD